ncbi:MAG: hypothetical protein L0Y62_00485 [Nitrospirae bacterium]|nr:hypothetical protein [Nitrospirota bacterium]
MEDAEDLTQETFLKAYEAFSKGAEVISPKGHLLSGAVYR